MEQFNYFLSASHGYQPCITDVLLRRPMKSNAIIHVHVRKISIQMCCVNEIHKQQRPISLNIKEYH